MEGLCGQCRQSLLIGAPKRPAEEEQDELLDEIDAIIQDVRDMRRQRGSKMTQKTAVALYRALDRVAGQMEQLPIGVRLDDLTPQTTDAVMARVEEMLVALRSTVEQISLYQGSKANEAKRETVLAALADLRTLINDVADVSVRLAGRSLEMTGFLRELPRDVQEMVAARMVTDRDLPLFMKYYSQLYSEELRQGRDGRSIPDAYFGLAKHVIFAAGKMPSDGFASLARFAQLEEIHISTDEFLDPAIRDTYYAQLFARMADLPTLTTYRQLWFKDEPVKYLASLTNIQRLDLVAPWENQPFRMFMTAIGQMTQLTELKVSNIWGFSDTIETERITRMADVIIRLPRLNTLRLSHPLLFPRTPNLADEVDKIISLSTLTSLEIFTEGSLPSGLASRQNLRSLAMIGMRGDLPRETYNMTQLQHLSFASSDGGLRSNAISIWEEVQWHNLQSLTLDYAYLANIDSQLWGELPSLEALRVAQDVRLDTRTNPPQTPVLPEEFTRLTRLHTLELIGQGLMNIDALRGLTRLRYLDLSNNNVSLYDYELALHLRTGSLETLILRSQRGKSSYPTAMLNNGAPRLRHLDLTNSSIPANTNPLDFTGTPRLTELLLGHIQQPEQLVVIALPAGRMPLVVYLAYTTFEDNDLINRLLDAGIQPALEEHRDFLPRAYAY